MRQVFNPATVAVAAAVAAAALMCPTASASAATSADLLRDDYEWLLNESQALLTGCRLNSTVSPGTVLFTPDAVNGYGAQWTRDFVRRVGLVAPSFAFSV